jgi:hypothetical protein
MVASRIQMIVSGVVVIIVILILVWLLFDDRAKK